jgi:hypothetical protein
MTDELVLIAFTILIPITPAYILYKALPSTSTVEGPLHGLNIRLTGAFGGYFLLVLLIFGFHYSQPRYEVWEVQGQLKTDQGLSGEKPQLSLLPSTINVSPDGRFKVLIARMPGINGDLKFPQLHIEHQGYQTVDLDLNEIEPGYGQAKCHISKSHSERVLKLDNIVVLQQKATEKESAYYQAGPKSQVPELVPTVETEVKP